MSELYETKISDIRWWMYDIPGNSGWIIYYVCVAGLIKRGFNLFVVAALVPAILMLIGIMELRRGQKTYGTRYSPLPSRYDRAAVRGPIGQEISGKQALFCRNPYDRGLCIGEDRPSQKQAVAHGAGTKGALRRL